VEFIAISGWIPMADYQENPENPHFAERNVQKRLPETAKNDRALPAQVMAVSRRNIWGS